jgi:acyl-CoA thioesterase II
MDGMDCMAGMADFEVDTRAVARDGRDGEYTATLSDAWEIWGPNGGYLAAIALRAAGAEAKIARPVVFSGHYLRVARFEPVQINVRALQRGRRSESFQVSLSQGGKSVLEAMVRTALPTEGLEHSSVQAPDVPDPESLPEAKELRKSRSAAGRFWNNFEIRVVDPELFNPDENAAKRPTRYHNWYRFQCANGLQDPFVDAARSLLLVDTLQWPAVWQAHRDSTFVAPSLDVTTWFHDSASDSEWLYADATSPIGAGGLIGGSARVWSRDGRLVATGGGQMLCMPAPKRA